MRLCPPSPFACACLAALALFAAAYANSLHNGFHFDDDHVIERNLHLRDLSNIPRFFTDARTFSVYPQNATWRPLVTVTLSVDDAVAGGLDDVVPFHLTQLTLFALVGVLFAGVGFRVLRKTGDAPWHRWAALFAAALFCVHTGNTQPGNYISARSELLCALGVLGAFYVYLTASPRVRRLHLHLVPMVLGALAKTPAVLFAPLLLVYVLIFEAGLTPDALRSHEGWRRIGRAVLSTFPTIVVATATFLFVEGMNPAQQTYGGGDRLAYLWTQAFVVLRYVGLFFVPIGLSADTDLTLLPSPLDVRVFAGIAVIAVSLLLAALALGRKTLRPVAFGILWFWIALLPTSSIFPLAEVTNDHRMFLGYPGLCLAAATFAFDRWPRRLVPAGVAVAGAVLIAHAVGTHLRNQVWRDEETLWADVIRKSPKNGRGWMNYGLTQMRKGRLREAKDLFLHAQQLAPHYPLLEVNLGIVRAALKEPEAERHFLRALALGPHLAAPHHYYARFLIDAGRAPEAVVHLETALRIDPADPHPRHLLMALLAARADESRLAQVARETLAFGQDAVAAGYLRGEVPLRAWPDDAAGWYALGLELTRTERHLDAALAYRTAVRRGPATADAWNNLGWSLYRLGFGDEARTAYARALSLRPDHERARNNLALLPSP